MIFLAVFFSTIIPFASHALINGDSLDKKYSQDLVRIEFEKKESICTGFFINRKTIITAAHCFYSYKDKRKLSVSSIYTLSNKDSLNLVVNSIIQHPDYYPDGWSSNDVGVIKVSEYSAFEGRFKILKDRPTRLGKLLFLGAGKVDLDKKVYGFRQGQNNFIKFKDFLFSLGKSKDGSLKGEKTSIAPNDSGGPVLDLRSKKVIAIASKSTVPWSFNSFWPALSVSTLISEGSNYQFLKDNL